MSKIYAHDDGTLIGEGMDALRRTFPNVSIPDDPTQQMLESIGAVVLNDDGRPSDTPLDRYRPSTRKDGDSVVLSWIADSVADRPAALAIWKDRLIESAKAEANHRILAILPEWKQRNYTARAVEKVANSEVGDDEWNVMQTAWVQIKAVRVASDAIEVEIAALTEEQAGQYDVGTNPFWP